MGTGWEPAEVWDYRTFLRRCQAGVKVFIYRMNSVENGLAFDWYSDSRFKMRDDFGVDFVVFGKCERGDDGGGSIFNKFGASEFWIKPNLINGCYVV